MNIDVKSEKLIRLADVPRLPWLPAGREGEPVKKSTVYGWKNYGVAGVKLETINAPTACTTEAALLRFFEAITNPPASTKVATRRTSERTSARLDALGI